MPLNYGNPREIIANAANIGRAAATKTTVRNLTNSTVASSRIEYEYPDHNAVEASIRRRIVAGPPGAGQGERDEPGIAAVTGRHDHHVPLTAERLHQLHPRVSRRRRHLRVPRPAVQRRRRQQLERQGHRDLVRGRSPTKVGLRPAVEQQYTAAGPLDAIGDHRRIRLPSQVPRRRWRLDHRSYHVHARLPRLGSRQRGPARIQCPVTEGRRLR